MATKEMEINVPSKAVFLHNAGCAVLWNVEKVRVASLTPPQSPWREAATRLHSNNTSAILGINPSTSVWWYRSEELQDTLHTMLRGQAKVKFVLMSVSNKRATCVYFLNATNMAAAVFRAMLSSVSFQCPVSFHAEQCKQNTCDYLKH